MIRERASLLRYTHIACLVCPYLLSNKDEWDRLVVWYVWGEVYTVFWQGNPKERDKLKDLRVGGRKMDRDEIGWLVVDWIDLADDKDNRRAVVNTVMNIHVP